MTIFVEGSENDYLRMGAELPDLTCCLHTIHDGHEQVHQHLVRRVLFAAPHGLRPIAGDPGKRILRRTGKGAAQYLHRDRVVIDDGDPHDAPPMKSSIARNIVSS